MNVIYHSNAELDLAKIESYLAERFYPNTSANFVKRIRKTCEALALMPKRGFARPDVGPAIRSISFERRAIIYFEVLADAVLILAVHYGGRSQSFEAPS